jgi:hypothetical protein
VLLIIGGVVTCYTAAGMARDAGVELFESSETEDGDNIVKNALDEDGLNKISLILKNTDVNIYGGSDESYIEMVNYGVNSYSYTETASILTVDESVGFLSLLNFTDTSVSFGGLRQYLNWKNKDEGRHKINIYLTNSYSIKQLEIKLDSGDITVNNVKNRADFLVKISKGNLLFNNNTSNSAATVDIGEGNATFRSSNLITLDATLGQGDLRFYVFNYSLQTYNIATGEGEVYFNGEDKGMTLNTSTPMGFITINAELKKGDVYIGDTDPTATETETETSETAAETEVAESTSAVTEQGAA